MPNIPIFAAIGGYELTELKSMVIMQGFAGITLFSVFLLMALGLVIIFGQMKVINMAHGEFLTAGAYTTVFLSEMTHKFMPSLMPIYFPVAMLAAFGVAFLLGWIVEYLLIRHLYSRPLDTLLATWGISMIMQQGFRLIFGGREAGAIMPEWLMGSWNPSEGLDIPINGIFLLTTAICMTLFIYFLLQRSRWGLGVRATVLNRTMANAVGINTARTDRMTFAIGCGLAGIAGAAFTTYGSVSPAAGSLYIIDSFIVVVFGGAGSIVGTIFSAFSIAQAQSILEFFTSGVIAKVMVLLAVIVILMIRPQGLVAMKVRR